MKTTETLEQWMERTNVQVVERSVIPREVALEMLASPGVKLGGKERRMFRNALEKHFTSTLQQKPREVKLAFKLQHSTWPQLNKWLRRTTERYMSMQKRYSLLAEKVACYPENTPHRKVGDAKLAQAGIIMGLCGEALECIEVEVETRAAKAAAADKISTEDVAV